MRTLEIMVRGNDQLDEQLHAGFFFYIFTSVGSFVENGQFVWGFALLIVGISIPIVLQGATHQEKVEKLRKEQCNEHGLKKDYSKVLALVYMFMVYGLGLIFSLLPDIY